MYSLPHEIQSELFALEREMVAPHGEGCDCQECFDEGRGLWSDPHANEAAPDEGPVYDLSLDPISPLFDLRTWLAS